ncbi:apoptotic protease-activating factor 1 [Petromyzon marinus]|uniref:Apoptotic protease-activating factor 1 isoform X2 n=1 Tax=Petromyzon marinus TaxID=7757 RepID=A0AAJ7T7N0_PETMA|nr:apoptotic protease-activating factor 1 isoform X2 [Petromyzon marinus]
MDERTRSGLLQHRTHLVRDVKPVLLFDHLVSDGVLTDAEEEQLRAQVARQVQASELLKLLLNKDNYAVISFYNALVKENYIDLAALLQDFLPIPMSPSEEPDHHIKSGSSAFEMMLREGGVPQRPVVFVERTKQLGAVREALLGLRGAPGWVVLHGMAGCGKSVIAAEAVRDPKLVKECFPGGVFWVCVGQVDKPTLLIKLQNLCQRLQPERERLDLHNLEQAKDTLRLILTRHHPRCLLLLDDVWDSRVVKAFDVHSRVLLTSRDSSVTDLATGAKHRVFMDQGLSEEQCLQVLAQWVGREIKDLPEEAAGIVAECRGSPLVVTLIGALLKDFPSRWSYYLKQLQKKQFKRIRKPSSYDYDALDEAMEISVSALQVELQDHYNDLVVFQKDTKISSKVLSVLWDMDVVEVEDTMKVLVDKSLAFQQEDADTFTYSLHDLQHDFLVEKNHAVLQKRHAKLVDRYFVHSGKNFSSLPDDGYVHFFLATHMAEAGQKRELCELLFSLEWVEAKLRVVGCAHLINDYLQHEELITNSSQERSMWKDFLAFLSVNGHHFTPTRLPDVLQLALCQPDSSAVCAQARARLARGHPPNTVYLDWLNKACVAVSQRLVVRAHAGAVYHAAFSRSGEYVASCAGDGYLKKWNSRTGEELMATYAHDEPVLCCAFAPNGRVIATGSADHTVKLWNAQSGRLLGPHRAHDGEVQHCTFAHAFHKPLLATCSQDSSIKLWEWKEQGKGSALLGHSGPVRCCCFSPDDQRLVSCSVDCTLKVWSVKLRQEERSVDVRECVDSEDGATKEGERSLALRSCAWSPDGRRIVAVAENIVFVFNALTVACENVLRTHAHCTILAVAFAPDSLHCAVGLSSYSLEMWNVKSCRKTADYRGHVGWVHGVAFSADGSWLLSASEDHTVSLWQVNGEESAAGVYLKRDTHTLFREDGSLRIAAPDINNCLRVVDETGQVVSVSDPLPSRVRCCCLSGDGRIVAMGCESGIMQIVDTESGNILHVLEGHTKCVRQCQFLMDGHVLLSCSDDATLRMWRWREGGGQCSVLDEHTEDVKCFCLLSQSLLLSCSFDGTTRLWDLNELSLVRTFCGQEPHAAILSCQVMPSLGLFVVTCTDKTAQVWQLDGGAMPLHVLQGHTDCVRSCGFSPDGKILATGDDEGFVMLWSVESGQKWSCQPTARHHAWVTQVSFVREGRILLSAADNIKFWDVESGRVLQTFYPRGSLLKRVHTSPDGNRLVTVDSIGLLYMLSLLPLAPTASTGPVPPAKANNHVQKEPPRLDYANFKQAEVPGSEN